MVVQGSQTSNGYLSGQHTEEDEDEHSLKGVCEGEQVGSEGRLMENVQHSKGPCGAEHKQQSHGTAGAGPGVCVLGNITD